MPPPSAAGTVAGGTIDSPQSQALSDYLKHHSLPLVGAQVVTSPSGGKQAILFGFVASDFGKTDAEQKARHYLKDPSLVVDNRIKVSPELAGSGSSFGSTVNGVPSANATPYDSSDPYAASGSIQDYQNNRPPGVRVPGPGTAVSAIQQRPAQHADYACSRCCSAAACIDRQRRLWRRFRRIQFGLRAELRWLRLRLSVLSADDAIFGVWRPPGIPY